MSRHITFRVGGPADLLLTPDMEQLGKVLSILRENAIPVTVIGNGSNLLVGDGGIRGAVIEIGRQMQEITVEGETVTAGAGALLSKVAQEAYAHGLSGLEFAAGIPGSIGGAMVMNAGAYGGEMKDVVVSVKVLTEDGEICALSCEEMDFGYRHSCVPEKNYVVLEASFSLQKKEKACIAERMEELKIQRVSKQPLEYPSAGSTFKRPEGYFAGKLIMDAGLAGYTVGGACVSEKHCGFVVNKAKGTAKDVLAVIRHVQKVVKEQYGVELETEVKMLGEF
ncbi:MAG: UDP-N-acetylmuramate dehydrogenase [Lachnospiraceae bacterium]|nr:UDP-N-acetylmuramate dehydrogenase [Lachnospiraceae bacterium]